MGKSTIELSLELKVLLKRGVVLLVNLNELIPDTILPFNLLEKLKLSVTIPEYDLCGYSVNTLPIPIEVIPVFSGYV